jgi:hypothetical protein
MHLRISFRLQKGKAGKATGDKGDVCAENWGNFSCIFKNIWILVEKISYNANKGNGSLAVRI